MVEGVAELLDGKLEDVVVARTDGHLIEVGQVVVHLADLVFLGEGVADALEQLQAVDTVEEQDGVGFLPVASGAARLLEVGLDAVGAVGVDDYADVGLVDVATMMRTRSACHAFWRWSFSVLSRPAWKNVALSPAALSMAAISLVRRRLRV